MATIILFTKIFTILLGYIVYYPYICKNKNDKSMWTFIIAFTLTWIVWRAAGGSKSDTYVPPYLGGDENGKWRK